MANLWDDIAKTIREGVDSVVEKTEQLSKIGKIKVDILNIKRNIEKNFAELGGKVYHLTVEEKKTQINTDKEVKAIIDSIKLLEKELKQKNAELEKLKDGEEVKPKSKVKPSSKPAAKSTAAKSKSTTVKKKSTTAKPKTSSRKSKSASTKASTTSKNTSGSKPKSGTGK